MAPDRRRASAPWQAPENSAEAAARMCKALEQIAVDVRALRLIAEQKGEAPLAGMVEALLSRLSNG